VNTIRVINVAAYVEWRDVCFRRHYHPHLSSEHPAPQSLFHTFLLSLYSGIAARAARPSTQSASKKESSACDLTDRDQKIGPPRPDAASKVRLVRLKRVGPARVV